jgi:hypothetical protein
MFALCFFSARSRQHNQQKNFLHQLDLQLSSNTLIKYYPVLLCVPRVKAFSVPYPTPA